MQKIIKKQNKQKTVKLIYWQILAVFCVRYEIRYEYSLNLFLEFNCLKPKR